VAAHGPGLRLVDDPAAVARLQSRATMLDSLRRGGGDGGGSTGGTGLVLTPQARPGSSSSLFAEEDEAGGGGGDAASPPPPPSARVLVGAPTQVVVPAVPAAGAGGAAGAAVLAAVAAAGLAPPLLAKPLLAGGQPGAHALALLTDDAAIAALAASSDADPLLPGLAPPLILQPYVPHRPPLFKVFVIGPFVALARRPSLTVPPPPEDVNEAVGGALSLARVSAFVSPAEAEAQQREDGREAEAEADTPPPCPDPPRWVLEALAAEMRAALGLQVFNFDLIRVARDLMAGPVKEEEEKGREEGGSGRGGGGQDPLPAPPPGPGPPGPCPPGADFLVIDINYFPGIEKLPGYEGLMVGFLQWVTGPEGTAATTGWVAGAACAARQAAAASEAAAAAVAAATQAPRPFPLRPASSGLQRLSMSLSQVPSRRMTGADES